MSSSMELPKVIVIGPMKSGTTWLHGYLHERGDVCLPTGVKETFYFDRNYDKGFRWYQKHFRCDPARHLAAAEVAPSYFHSDEAPARINSQLGNVSLLMVVRDPVRRAWSHYCHLLRYGYTRLSLQQATEEFPAILDASCYSSRLEMWGRFFPKGSLKICSFDKLSSNEAEFCRDACRALHIPFVPPKQGGKREFNAAAVSPSVLAARASRSTARTLRRQRLHFLVNAARDIGVKRLIYGSPTRSPPPELSPRDSSWLKSHLLADIVKFRDMVDEQDYPWLKDYR